MTRIVSSGYAGSTTQDVDPGAITFTREIVDAIGDFNLVDDYLSRNNSPANAHTHAGGVNGCPLGIPLGCSGQVSAPYSSELDVGGTEVISRTASDITTPLCVSAHHVYMPGGETSLSVGYDAKRFAAAAGAAPLRAFCVERDDLPVLADADLAELEIGDGFYFATFSALSPGQEYVIGIAIPGAFNNYVLPTAAGAPERPRSSVFFNRKAPQSERVYQGVLRTNTSPPEVPTTATGVGAKLGDRPLPQDGVVIDGLAMGNMFVKLLSRAQNVLTEELTGFPAGADIGGLTLADSTSGTDYRAFHDHSAQTGKTNEVAPVIPLFADSLGSFYASGDTDIGEGYGNAPSVYQYTGDDPGVDVVRVARLVPMPDVDDADLRVSAMIFKPVGTTTPTATIEIDSSFGPTHETSEVSMTVTRIGTTQWWHATAFSPASTRAVVNRFILRVNNVTSGNLGVATFSAWLE